MIYVATILPYRVSFLNSDANAKDSLEIVEQLFNGIYFIDIILCFFSSYYNDNDILILSKKVFFIIFLFICKKKKKIENSMKLFDWVIYFRYYFNISILIYH